MTHEELGAGYGADPADIARIHDVLARFGLEVTEADAGARRLTASGPVSAFTAAFGASLRRGTSPDPAGGPAVTHRYREGSLHLPAELDGIVTAVIGLDNRPQASPHFRPAASAANAVSYTPPQVGAFYQFPAGTDGTGQNLAIIELGGGLSQADLNTYFAGLGIVGPAVAAVSVDGAVSSPGGSADGEVMLDIEVAGAIAPKASQLVYFAPNSAQGFLDAVSAAVHANPTPTAISISWGQSEDSWSAQARAAMTQQFADACALGTTVCAAAGDNGAGDKVGDGQLHCDYPASDPNVLGCGGTSLTGSTATAAITAETVWNDGAGQGSTGGGISDAWPVPAYQAHITMPAGRAGRGVPDVAGNADPYTGYQIRVDGQGQVCGGTSAVAPLWAALICRLSQGTGARFGLLSTLLYAGVTGSSAAPGFQDITVGGNNGYNAGPGWDPCTGLGTPNGAALLTRLRPRMYVSTASANTVSVLATPGSTVLSTIAVGGNPQCLAADPAGAHVYVTNHSDNTVSVISTTTAAVTATIPVGGAPIGIAVNPAGTLVYVGNNTSNTVSVISTATNTVTATIPVGSYPDDVAISPGGNLVYVANNGDNTVSVISTATNTVTATIAGLTAARQTAFNPAGTMAYVTSSIGTASNVSVINTGTNAIAATIPVGLGSFGVTVNPAGTVAYVSNSGSNTVSVISTATNTVTGTIAVGNSPLGVSLSPDGTLLYVANSVDGTVSVISTATSTVTATIAGLSGARYVTHQ